jgi:hypothetical protein
MERIGRAIFDNTKILSVSLPGKSEAKKNSMFYGKRQKTGIFAAKI